MRADSERVAGRGRWPQLVADRTPRSAIVALPHRESQRRRGADSGRFRLEQPSVTARSTEPPSSRRTGLHSAESIGSTRGSGEENPDERLGCVPGFAAPPGGCRKPHRLVKSPSPPTPRRGLAPPRDRCQAPEARCLGASRRVEPQRMPEMTDASRGARAHHERRRLQTGRATNHAGRSGPWPQSSATATSGVAVAAASSSRTKPKYATTALSPSRGRSSRTIRVYPPGRPSK